MSDRTRRKSRRGLTKDELFWLHKLSEAEEKLDELKNFRAIDGWKYSKKASEKRQCKRCGRTLGKDEPYFCLACQFNVDVNGGLDDENSL